MAIITSVQNPRVKAAARLRDRRARSDSGRTLLEGYRLLSRAHACGFPIEVCFFCPPLFLGVNEPALLDALAADGVETVEVAEHVLAKLAYRDRPEGLVAVAPVRRHGLERLPARPGGLYLVLEGIEKPGNLGAALRSADGCGIDGVLLCGEVTDLYNPNVLAASTGTVFSVPIAECSGPEAQAWLASLGLPVLAATPHAAAAYYDFDFGGGAALVFGSEQLGLSRFWLDAATASISIPMRGMADSLNVSTAASVILFEAARQRALRGRPARPPRPAGAPSAAD